MKRKKQKIIILILCLLLIILLVSLSLLKDKDEQEKIKESKKTQTYEEFIEEYSNKVIYPRNIAEMYNYEGEISSNNIYESFRTFVDYLSYLNNNVDTVNSEDFYNEKAKEIKNKLGIEDKDDFITFIEYISDKNVDSNDFRYAEIESGSSYVEERYFKFILNLHYGEENVVSFLVSWAEKENKPIPIIYEGLE